MKKFFQSLDKFERFLLFFTLIFLVISRFYRLGQIPVSLTHDETVYAVEARSFATQGINTSQKIKPWSMSLLHHMYAEWPATVMTPGFFLTDHPILATHLMTAVLGVLIPLALGLIFDALWKNKKLTLAAIFVATFNPLLWQFGRLAYDAIFSLAFYLIAAALQLQLKKKWKFLSIPFYVLGFFQYQGMKLLFFPWVLMIFALEFFSKNNFKSYQDFFKKFWQQFRKADFLILVFSFLLTLAYAFLILPNQDVGGRLSATILTDNDFLAPLVNTQRRLAISSPLGSFFSNKLTTAFEFVVNNLLSVFSPFLLFVQGETSASAFAVWSHGLFYLLDAVLLLFALVVIFSQKKYRAPAFVLVLSALAFSLPALINTMSKWYLLRSMMSYLLLIFLLAFAVAKILEQQGWKFLFLGIYAFSVINFAYQFFYRYPVYSADAAEFHERVLASYISRLKEASPEGKVIVYTNEPERYFADYLLYNVLLNDANKDQIAQAYQEESYQLDGVVFTNDCINFEEEAVLIGDILHSRCQLDLESPSADELEEYQAFIDENEKSALSIAAILDSGELLRLYGDQLCQPYTLNSFLRVNSLADFSVEKMNNQQFCQMWITDLRQLRD